MTTINRQAIVLHSAEDMYQLVDNIESYPEFLPWCRDAHELVRTEDEVKATIELAWGGFHKAFTTLNRLHPSKMIHIQLVHGPFKHLEGYWRFDMIEAKAVKVSLSLEFEFVSRIFSLPFSRVFEQIANSLVKAFSARADEVYGKSKLD